LLPYSLVAGGYAGNIHFQIEADDSPDFVSAVSVDSRIDQADWKIFTGYEWDDFPESGMPSTFKSACYLGTDLDGKTYYRWRAYYYDEDNGVYVYGDWFPGVGKIVVSGRPASGWEVDSKSACFLDPQEDDDVYIKLPFNCVILSVKVFCQGEESSVSGGVSISSNDNLGDPEDFETVGTATSSAGYWGVSEDLNYVYNIGDTLRFYVSSASGSPSVCTVMIEYRRI